MLACIVGKASFDARLGGQALLEKHEHAQISQETLNLNSWSQANISVSRCQKTGESLVGADKHMCDLCSIELGPGCVIYQYTFPPSDQVLIAETGTLTIQNDGEWLACEVCNQFIQDNKPFFLARANQMNTKQPLRLILSVQLENFWLPYKASASRKPTKGVL